MTAIRTAAAAESPALPNDPPASLEPSWHGRRHVLDLDDWEPGEIEQVLDTAVAMKEILARPIKKVPTLRGKTVVTPSTSPAPARGSPSSSRPRSWAPTPST